MEWELQSLSDSCPPYFTSNHKLAYLTIGITLAISCSMNANEHNNLTQELSITRTILNLALQECLEELEMEMSKREKRLQKMYAALNSIEIKKGITK